MFRVEAYLFSEFTHQQLEVASVVVVAILLTVIITLHQTIERIYYNMLENMFPIIFLDVKTGFE